MLMAVLFKTVTKMGCLTNEPNSVCPRFTHDHHEKLLDYPLEEPGALARGPLLLFQVHLVGDGGCDNRQKSNDDGECEL
jgi:hypothetical protein